MTEEKSVAIKALELWREWFESDGNPICAGECAGDLYCFFCGEYQVSSDASEQQHLPNCVYLRAQALLEGQNG